MKTKQNTHTQLLITIVYDIACMLFHLKVASESDFLRYKHCYTVMTPHKSF